MPASVVTGGHFVGTCLSMYFFSFWKVWILFSPYISSKHLSKQIMYILET